MRARLVVLAACALGCASVAAPPKAPPGSSVPAPWHTVRTPHFVVFAELDARTAVRAAQALEDARDALIAAAWPKLDFSNLEPTEVYVLADHSEFGRVFGRSVAGVHDGGAVVPRVFLSGPPETWDRVADPRFAAASLLRHELAHQLASLVYRRQPRWFAEGLAQFLATVVYAANHATVLMGTPNLESLERYRQQPAVTVRKLFAWERAGRGKPLAAFAKFYGLSWLLVHWLYNSRAEAFTRFQHELALGTAPEQAWEVAFPGFDLEGIDDELWRYSRHGEYKLITVPVPRSSRAFRAVALSAAEAHACRAEAASVATRVDKGRKGELLAEARTETLAARALDPANLRALSATIDPDPLDLAMRAQRALAAHPEDPRAHLLMARAQEAKEPHGPAAEASLRRAVALAPQDAGALEALARLLVKSGHPAAAIGFAMRAARRSPWSESALDTYARALFLTGSCPQALELQRRITVTDRPSEDEDDVRLLSHLAEYEAKCGDAEDE
jgi:hypothetical protein